MANNTIKIAETMFSEIKMLQDKFQELHGKFGNLGIEKMELDRIINDFVEREKKLKEEWITLKKLDEGLRDKLVKTYGEGSLNMADGTFTSTAPPTVPPSK